MAKLPKKTSSRDNGDLDPRFRGGFDFLIPSDTKKIAVATSGGADSFALLHMTHLWAQKNNVAVTAMTVDHGLRKESAAEAANIAKWCLKNDITHKTLNWVGVKPKTDIQNKARAARRALLFTACKKENIATLLMGHQADDQAETVLMRLSRGTGLNGLSGIHASSDVDGITLIRPLLSTRRSELRAYCVKHKLPFIDDSSNTDDAFERVRVRKILKSLPDLADGIEKTTQRLRRAEEALDNIAATWCETHVKKNALALAPFLTLPSEIQLRVLAHFIPDAPLDGLERLSTAITASTFKAQTLGGMWVRPKVINRAKSLLFVPAPPRN